LEGAAGEARSSRPSPTTAIILAAGLGARLRDLFPDLPKPLLPIGGRPLLAHSIEALRSRGVQRILLVVGYRAELLRAFAAGQPDLEPVENVEYATTGSMASLAVALRRLDEDVLLVEGDLAYEPRALDVVLGHDAPDVLLASGPTGAGDEIWLECEDGRLCAGSKDRAALRWIDGEMVGISRISRPLARAMLELYGELRASGRPGAAYEVDTLMRCARRHPVAVPIVPDLLWGEIDFDAQHRRIVDQVWPAIARNLGQGPEAAG